MGFELIMTVVVLVVTVEIITHAFILVPVIVAANVFIWAWLSYNPNRKDCYYHKSRYEIEEFPRREKFVYLVFVIYSASVDVREINRYIKGQENNY